jgi:two-component system, NtrC family, sensor histidine kinase PilS
MPTMASNKNVNSPTPSQELSKGLLKLILIRAGVLLLGLNLADRLSLLPAYLGQFPFLAFFNIAACSLTALYLALWRIGRQQMLQLYLQIGIDLILSTVLVAYTRGIESSFVSFYLLIIIYCSLSLGRNGGMVGAALTTILYSGIIFAIHLGFPAIGGPDTDSRQAIFRISIHVIGFWAVAYLGSYLHQQLQIVKGELKEKTDSVTQLKRVNEHIVSSIRSGLITTDLHGRISLFNAAAGELTERNTQEMLDKQIQSLLGEAFWYQILEADLLRSAKPLRHEEWVTLPSGARRFLGFSVSPLRDNNQLLLGYIVSFQDLTEITRLEEEVRLKEKMAVIGRMAAGIAHEIRNPLTAMRGSVEILRSHANLPPKDERLLEILIRESDRLNKFVGDFLDFARPRKYQKGPLDLVSVLRDSVILLRNSPEIRENHSVTLDIDDPSVRIFGSADQLNQVFWNLAQNAVRAMPNGGQLKISLRKTSDNTGQIIFEDNGIGMNREEQDQIFQPFHSGFAGGLGLGLSIIFQIMEDHQGKISFESEKGNGTKVSLSFPLEIEAPTPEALGKSGTSHSFPYWDDEHSYESVAPKNREMSGTSPIFKA